MTQSMKKTYIISILLFISCCSIAQNKLQGQALNVEGKRISEAIVTAYEIGSNKSFYSVMTDTLGRFILPSCPGRFRINIAAFGYENETKEINSELYINKSIEVILQYISIGEVIVTANAKPRMTRDGNKLFIDKLENSPHAKGSDLYTFMRFIPVLKVPSFDGNVTLRETAGGCAVLLVNGKNIHIPMDAYLKNVRVENIERIEVIAYPMGEYKVTGDCGVINLIMKRREDEGIQYNLSLTDKQYGLNSQNGVFSVSYTKKKMYVTFGAYANNSNVKSDSKSDYRFHDNNRQRLEKNDSKDKNLMFSGYFNLDYELNPKNTLGVQFGAEGVDTDVTFETNTQHKNLFSTSIDSVYHSQSNTSNPSKFSGMNANLNYTRKIDNNGSALYVDLDYRMSRPKSYTHNFYHRISETTTDMINKTDILQKNNTYIDSYGTWLRHNQVLSPKTQLNSGIYFYCSNSRYAYAYGEKKNEEYVDDSNRSNRFCFDDHILSAYTALSHKWNKKLNVTIGVKMDAYGADGEQKTTGERISRHEVNLLPSINILYKLSNEHIFLFNAKCSADQPHYSQLNPFKTYVSHTTYQKGNPDLKSSKMYSGGLTYNFMDDYSLTAYLMYVNNISANLSFLDDNDQVMIMPANRGKMFYNTWSLSADKTFFNGYLNTTCDVSYSFRQFDNKIPNLETRQRKNIYGIELDANLFISKRKKLSAYFSYDFSTEDMGTAYAIPDEHNFNCSLIKRFENSNLSIGIYKGLRRKDKRIYEQQNYSYTTWQKNYWLINLSYSVTFGNKRTRYVGERTNDEMKSRISKD